MLPNWNAKWHGQRGLCEWLQRIGITALKMSMPYHDRRMAKGHERADQVCGPNIGLTLQANRQAVHDARRCLRWLEQQGHTRLGILGTSLGSSVGYITLMHDAAINAGGFFHFSTYYADVVSQGMTTNHVWEGLRNHVTVDELRDYWAPISPMPYVERGMGADRKSFLVYGKYDPTMLPGAKPPNARPPSAATAPIPAACSSTAATTPSNYPPSATSPATACSPSSAPLWPKSSTVHETGP